MDLLLPPRKTSHATTLKTGQRTQKLDTQQSDNFRKVVSLGNLGSGPEYDYFLNSRRLDCYPGGVAWSLHRKLRILASVLCVDRKSISDDKSPTIYQLRKARPVKYKR